MIKVLITGGKLQGTEIAYLAKKAGYYSILLDKNPDIPAKGLVDRFIKEDVFNKEKILELFREVDVVIPGIENKKILETLLEYGEITKTKVIFDKNSYNISSSKQLSNKLFYELELPLPEKYPCCNYPVIIKPDHLSGSSNVHKAFSKEEVDFIAAQMDGEIVIQEYLEGNSFSLEVLGDGESFFYPQITEVVVDENYDCKRIIAPAQISPELKEQFYTIAEKLARVLKIKGIFDIEVINDNGTLKLLEIDARFPSQTPISVYKSTGINMVEILVELVLGTFTRIKKAINKVCYYQQIVVKDCSIKVMGEHVMEGCINLRVIEGFFGADEGITDFVEGCNSFTAIIIVTAHNHKKAYDKFLMCMDNIKNSIKKSVVFMEG
ncbi:UNVERIFIED_CONTAM: pyrrolysine biosynthesis protein PylC [Acetivibrio alkalicellulosi]